MAATPVPSFSAPPDFPALSDRALGTYNSKAFAWATAWQGTTGPNVYAIAQTAYLNAQEAAAQTATAVSAANSAATASEVAIGYRNTAQLAATTAIAKAAESAASATAASKLNLGDKSSPPTTDNQGGALLAGATYYDTTLAKWRVWTGAAWGDGISAVAGVASVSGKAGNVTLTGADILAGNLPTIRPSLLLDFANSKQVDPRITFTRASTATRVNKFGLIESVASGVPRIDHDPVTGECKGLLIEEARTNLLKYSEQFDNAAWGKLNASISANAVAAPNGAVVADKLVEDATAAVAHQAYMAVSGATNADPYTASIYARAAERSLINLFVVDGATYTRLAQCTFNLASGVAGSVSLGGGATGSASMQDVGGGWYRCSVTVTLGGSDTSIQLRVRLADAGGNTSYTGDGTSGIYVWGAQLE